MAKAARKEEAELNINLMPVARPAGPTGEVIHWVLTIGRYFVIFTEIIALAIFVLGIKLASDKNTLKSDIGSLQKQVSSDENVRFEQSFRSVQKRIQEVARLRKSHFETGPVVSEYLTLLPQGMTLKSLNLKEGELTFSGFFSTPDQLQTLVSSLYGSDKITGLDISDLNSPTETNTSYSFTAKATIIPTNFEENSQPSAEEEK